MFYLPNMTKLFISLWIKRTGYNLFEFESLNVRSNIAAFTLMECIAEWSSSNFQLFKSLSLWSCHTNTQKPPQFQVVSFDLSFCRWNLFALGHEASQTGQRSAPITTHHHPRIQITIPLKGFFYVHYSSSFISS